MVLTEPEMININELKRLLVEIVDEILSTRDLAMSHDEKTRQRKRIIKKIDNSILNGDDS